VRTHVEVRPTMQQTIDITRAQDHAWGVGSWGAGEFWGIILKNLDGKFDVQINNNMGIHPLMGQTSTLENAKAMIRKHIEFAVHCTPERD